MFKFILLLKRKPGLSQEEFINHYNNVHIPMGTKLFPDQTRKHIRNFPIDVENAPYDCISEVFFDSEEAFNKFMAVYANNPDDERVKAIYDDESKFFDREKIIFIPVNEVVSDFT